MNKADLVAAMGEKAGVSRRTRGTLKAFHRCCCRGVKER